MKTREYFSVVVSFVIPFLAITGAFRVGLDVLLIELSGRIMALVLLIAIGFIVALFAIAISYILKKDETMSSVNGLFASAGAIIAMVVVILPETTYKIIVPLVISEFVLVGFVIALGIMIALRDISHHKLSNLFQVT